MEALDISALREQLAGIGGSNPLTNFELSSFGQVDLARSHPGGLAQLVTSRSTTLSNLVRDGVAQARAHSAVRRIRNNAQRIEAGFAIASCFIAAGMVENRTANQKLPILLWPTHIIPKGDDYEIRIDAQPRLNPALLQLLVSARSDFRPQDLMAVSVGQGDLVPISALSLVSEVLHGTDVEIEKLLVLGNFVPDLLSTFQSAPLDPPALPGPNQQLASVELSTIVPVENADHSQLEVIQKALSGASFLVETLPGTGYLQTVVNLLSNLSLQGKRALLVAPRAQTLDEVAERLSQSGLGGLAIREADTWSDLVAAISRNEKAIESSTAQARSEKAKAERAIEDYFGVIGNEDAELGITLVDCLRELAALEVLPNAPKNSARIRQDLLPGLVDRVGELVERAHEAKVFAYGPTDTPWYRARFNSSEENSRVLEQVRSIAGEPFRTLSYQINRYLADQKLVACSTVEDWATQLRLLIGIRETLDRFLPSIYDRSLAQLITATAPRAERKELSGAQRRRFRKLAKEYVRPGSSVPNLHAALELAEQQRLLWLELNQTQAPPQVPLGLNDVQEKYERLHSLLELLQRHLDPDPDKPLLTKVPFDQLGAMLEELATKTEILDHLLERGPIQSELAQAGLSDFAHEMCKIKPELPALHSELLLCWWQSALEALVNRNPRILEFSASNIAELEQDFDAAASQLLAAGLASTKWSLATAWKSGIVKFPAQADRLRNMLRQRDVSLRSAANEAAGLWELIAPNLLISPYRISEVANREKFDVLMVLDAASTGVAELAPSLYRAQQVIAFGDSAVAAPESFETVARASVTGVESARESFFDLMERNYPKLSLRRNYRTEGQVLGRYLNENFYRGQLILDPAAGQLFGSHNFEQIEIIDGAFASSTIEGATESLDAEVAKVTELVLNHARWTPQQSLCVVTASHAHADRVAQAVEREVASQPQLAEFFDAHGREKFDVRPMSQHTHRLADRVIFSVGFGRTPEGRISGTLGDFNSANASRWMVNTIVSARKRLTLVSCYNFEDFAAGKLPENQKWLKDLIAPSFLSDLKTGEPDPLLSDLALRLTKLGFNVALNFGGRIGLAVSLGDKAAVIDPDWALLGENWDERLRLRPGLLRAMGWQYIRVHALEIFAQPQEVANRIAKSMGVDLERKAQPLFEDKAFEDTSRAWGDPDDSNDDRLRDERPPHWG
ncbi:hypothetical protein HRU87_01745 [Aquiluna borgnonia]|uniref:Uncharacterized protein n=1 Tax=Aquiluna borgnonia TaxID=2499157 RepID=A0A7D4TTJ0_9MICO|nr:hypothetical protein [Aquiluna borgnonia]QKJ24635.1 hypothetical protein HRU87_01745 [Aquiluna borgnonia]